MARGVREDPRIRTDFLPRIPQPRRFRRPGIIHITVRQLPPWTLLSPTIAPPLQNPLTTSLRGPCPVRPAS